MAKKDDILGVSSADTVIGSGVKVKGNLISEGDVVVDGLMSGNIKAGGNITLGVNAHVLGDVIGQNVRVAGTLNGNISASESTSITETGEVAGDIATTILNVESGALFIGTSKMKRSVPAEIIEEAT